MFGRVFGWLFKPRVGNMDEIVPQGETQPIWWEVPSKFAASNQSPVTGSYESHNSNPHTATSDVRSTSGPIPNQSLISRKDGDPSIQELKEDATGGSKNWGEHKPSLQDTSTDKPADSGSSKSEPPRTVADLHEDEKRALHAVTGLNLAPTSPISDSQVSVLRKFAGIDFGSVETAQQPRHPNNRHESQTQPVDSYRQTVGHSNSKHSQIDSVLNDEQQRVFDFIEKSNRNLFITGRAGSGKSFLLRYLLKNSSRRILPVAFMGIAALNIGGSTIHSAFGLPLKPLLPSTGKFLADRLSQEGREHYRQYKLLVVDEVSMVAADQFLAMDMFLRSIHENNEPFGGIQVVLFGDPYQLPPVVIGKSESDFYADNWGGPYFFLSESWSNGAFVKIELQGAERQTDRAFLELLDSMRVGELSDSDWFLLQSRVFPEESIPKSGVVRIAPTNELADKHNDSRLKELPGTAHLFQGEASGEYRKGWQRLPAPMKLFLKEGAQVIMVKNDSGRRWANGSIGRVMEISASKIVVEVDGLHHEVDQAFWDKENHTYNRAQRVLESDSYSRYSQYPLALGWARTIHKSQGQTFDKCVVDLRSRMFASGQAYVACSRTRDIDGLYFTAPLTMGDVVSSSAVHRFMEKLDSPMTLPMF